MTLNEFIKGLQEFLEENPESGELPVWYARDDEGNGYQQVYYSPLLRYLDNDDVYCGGTRSDSLIDADGIEECPSNATAVVLIN